MCQTVYAPMLVWAMLGYASGQQPPTLGVGQYCSYYTTGFTSNLGGQLDVHAYANNYWTMTVTPTAVVTQQFVTVHTWLSVQIRQNQHAHGL
jgi:hypothetical protein